MFFWFFSFLLLALTLLLFVLPLRFFLSKSFFSFILLFSPFFIFSIYLHLGSPNFDTSVPLDSQSLEELLVRTERILVDNPDDIRGWWLLVRAYDSLGRIIDRDRALAQVERLRQREQVEP